MISLIILGIALVAVLSATSTIGKASKNHIWHIHCQVGNKVLQYQTQKVHYRRGAIDFKTDNGQRVVCGQFFLAEIPLNQ